MKYSGIFFFCATVIVIRLANEAPDFTLWILLCAASPFENDLLFFFVKSKLFSLLFWWYISHFCSDLATDFFTTFWLHQSDISLCIKMKNCSIWILASKIRNSKYYLVTLSDRKKLTFKNRNFFLRWILNIV